VLSLQHGRTARRSGSLDIWLAYIIIFIIGCPLDVMTWFIDLHTAKGVLVSFNQLRHLYTRSPSNNLSRNRWNKKSNDWNQSFTSVTLVQKSSAGFTIELFASEFDKILFWLLHKISKLRRPSALHLTWTKQLCTCYRLSKCLFDQDNQVSKGLIKSFWCVQ
jgi:hypothetical protein